MGILNIYEQFVPLYVLMCLYNTLFLTSEGSIIWMYANEVTVAAAGLIVFGVFGALFLQTMTLESMINSPMKPEGVFFFYGGCTGLGGIYIWLLFKETTGLTD